MLSELLVYLRLGFTHIADPRGYDHILFVAALTGGYAPSAWRHLLWLVTAFTVGHSITLALATLGVVAVPAALVELLIPVTIVITSAMTVAAVRTASPDAPVARRRWDLYALALLFGLVHGLGFSTYLRALLGAEEGIARPLLAFNAGLELGQLLIVAFTLLAGTLAVRLLGLARRDWVLLLAGATAGVACTMILDRLAGV